MKSQKRGVYKGWLFLNIVNIVMVLMGLKGVEVWGGKSFTGPKILRLNLWIMTYGPDTIRKLFMNTLFGVDLVIYPYRSPLLPLCHERSPYTVLPGTF